MIEKCCEVYKEFVKKAANMKPHYLLTQKETEILNDPVKAQMWHSSFDPHIHVPEVVESNLKQLPHT